MDLLREMGRRAVVELTGRAVSRGVTALVVRNRDGNYELHPEKLIAQCNEVIRILTADNELYQEALRVAIRCRG